MSEGKDESKPYHVLQAKKGKGVRASEIGQNIEDDEERINC